MAAPYIDQLRYVSVADKTTVNLRETPGGSGHRQSGFATLSSFALTHWSNGFTVLPAVRSCNEAFSGEKARKSPHMSPIFDLKLKGLRALQRHPGFVDGLNLRETPGSSPNDFFTHKML